MISAEIGEIFVKSGKYKCSTQIAEQYDKLHKNVLKDIRSILKREKEFATEFIQGAYRDMLGRIKSCYYLTPKAEERLHNRYMYNSTCASLEKSIGEWLHTLFPSQKIIKQYKVLQYRIDFYFEDLNIAVEYDETQHKYQTDADTKRQKEIQKKLYCHFVRIKQGKEIQGIKELLFLINEITGENPLLYMQ